MRKGKEQASHSENRSKKRSIDQIRSTRKEQRNTNSKRRKKDALNNKEQV